MSPDDLSGYLGRIIAELPLPLMLYNIPQLTKVRIEPQTLERARQWERVIGLKDSSNDRAYLEQVLAVARKRPDWSIFVGAEGLLPDVIHQGGHGGVCGGANLAPALFVEMYEAAVRRDDSSVAALRQRISELGKIYRIGPSLPDSIRGQKQCLSILGICSPQMAEPFAESRPGDQAIMRARLQSFGLRGPDSGR
jgi:4-hydroxy-tetrahydrodipicolinate synthase